MEMETCVRGFSFMPKENVSSESLQYIEGEELTRKWRASHRERQRQREQRIWEEFVVKENDVLSTLCKDDPYQFLEQLPEECLKELMEIQLAKMKQEKEDEEAKIVELSQQGDGDSPAPAAETPEVQHVVTFADEVEREEDMFHIFDDNDKDDDKLSGPEDEGTDSLSPSTVRERSDASPDSRALSPDKGSSKSSENVANMIENSIYFAKVKDLRIKMSEELAEIVLSLERRDIMNIDPADLVKMCRRSSEFSSRFNRVHMYQLKRQINDLQRNNSVSLPFAKHTQFQAQMVRIASLHQNMLQAFQIFHKSIEQTACVRESIDTLRGLVTVCRQGLDASHQHLIAAGNLSSDKVIPSCEGLEEAINEYAAKLSSYMDSTENTHTSHSRRSPKKGKMSSLGTWSKSGGNKSVGSGAGTRLSMYSLDTLRINLKSKKSKDRSSGGTSKFRARTSPSRARGPPPASPRDPDRSPRKTGRKRSPRSRRPLMRDPDSGRSKSKKRKIPKENEIRTMVETVGTITCTSSRISCEATPSPPPKSHRRSKETTPRSTRGKIKTPRRSPAKKSESPSPTRKTQSPKFKRRLPPLGLKDGNIRAGLRNEIQGIGSPRTGAKSDRKVVEAQKKLPEVKEVEANETTRSAVETHRSAYESTRSLNETMQTVSEVPCSAVGSSYIVESDSSRQIVHTVSQPVSQQVGQPISQPVSQPVSPSTKRGEMMTSEKRCEIAARERNKTSTISARCEVTRIVRQLCGGDTAGRNERVSGAKNAQLLCVSGSSPGQPSTPQLLRILEETIQKKVPKQLFQPTHKDKERLRMVFNIPEATTERLFQYRTKFVQHMLTSPMYANSVVGKPWEVISRISDQIINELLANCAKEIQLEDTLKKLYETETR